MQIVPYLSPRTSHVNNHRPAGAHPLPAQFAGEVDELVQEESTEALDPEWTGQLAAITVCGPRKRRRSSAALRRLSFISFGVDATLLYALASTNAYSPGPEGPCL
jgi:hypothetical protein